METILRVAGLTLALIVGFVALLAVFGAVGGDTAKDILIKACAIVGIVTAASAAIVAISTKK